MAENRRTGRKALEKAVAPAVAALTTATIRYLVKKGPRYVEQNVLPTLREGGRSASDIGETLTQRARTASSQSKTRPTRSADELERRRRTRARHRAGRRKATS